MGVVTLSSEQEQLVQAGLAGHNVLVDACIGSGKTTTIQRLCDLLPTNKSILYLTYNRLLKAAAIDQIQNDNVFVTNYHSFALRALNNIGVRVGVSDLIPKFNALAPFAGTYDILILDEYQDIEQEIAVLLEIILKQNPKLQIIAVGDMHQKIYDKTTLDAADFIHKFLGDYVKIDFTICFRLSNELAERLGNLWSKTIVGVNDQCVVREMSINRIVDYLSTKEPGDILCLGSRTGAMVSTLNSLERYFSGKFNKNTVFASIQDSDGSLDVDPNAAIFTTFDSSKGLERKVCVVFDWSEEYWAARIDKPQQSSTILRNLFLVAASRGKSEVIFVTSQSMTLISDETLQEAEDSASEFGAVNVSQMFDFKYKEDVDAAYNLLKIEKIDMADDSQIEIENHDGLIDLSPCVGVYQEAVFFNGYNIDEVILETIRTNKNAGMSYSRKTLAKKHLDEKIFILTALETKQDRYVEQTKPKFVNLSEHNAILRRLGSVFSPDERVQVKCALPLVSEAGCNCVAMGAADVVKDNVVYELKFVSSLSHEHFLQCASYIVALKLECGVLWNVKTNEMYIITIPNRELFMNAVVRAVTKGSFIEHAC